MRRLVHWVSRSFTLFHSFVAISNDFHVSRIPGGCLVLRSLRHGEGVERTSGRWGEERTSAAAPRVEGRPTLTNGEQSRGQNRIREIRLSGIAGRLQETWLMGELGTHRATERALLVTLLLMVCAPDFYPDIRPLGSVEGVAGKPGVEEHWKEKQRKDPEPLKRRCPKTTVFEMAIFADHFSLEQEFKTRIQNQPLKTSHHDGF